MDVGGEKHGVSAIEFDEGGDALSSSAARGMTNLRGEAYPARVGVTATAATRCASPSLVVLLLPIMRLLRTAAMGRVGRSAGAGDHMW